MKINNPFIITGYISPEYFCDRDVESASLSDYASNSQNAALFSVRRMGKTGLIRHLFNSLTESGIKCIYIDIMMTDSFEDFVYEFGKAYFNQAAKFSKRFFNKALHLLRGFTPSITADNFSGGLSIDLKLNRAEEIYGDFEKILEIIGKSDEKYLIAIDEFQQVLQYPEKNPEGLLRSQIQFINNASFLFSGSKKKMLLSFFGESSQPLWQSCSFIELNPIAEDKYKSFIRSRFEKKKRIIEEDVLDFIFVRTKGITYFVQLFCFYLYNTHLKSINLKTAREVFGRIISERESYYFNFTSLLTQKQKEILTAIARNSGISQPTGKEFLMKYELGAASTVKSALDAFIDKEIVYSGDGKYHISDVFFSEWLKIRSVNK